MVSIQKGFEQSNKSSSFISFTCFHNEKVSVVIVLVGKLIFCEHLFVYFISDMPCVFSYVVILVFAVCMTNCVYCVVY